MTVPWTLLELTGDDLPANFLGDYARRGIVMTLTMVDQAKRQRTTINGTRKDVSKSQYRKHAVTIACTDNESPRLYQLGIGKVLGVKAVAELGTHSEDTAGNPEQLQLSMMVADWQVTRDEANAETGWSATLVEV